MFSLPNLAPRDSHNIWYSSSQHQHILSSQDSAATLEHVPNNAIGTGINAGGIGVASALTPAARRTLQPSLNSRRTPLARLRMDEESMARRRRNVQDYGSAWIRPPGVPKSLHQMREERREMEEHQEAMRRDALVQELADAEAAVVAEVMDDEGDEEVGRDLDDDVPEADGTGSSEDDSEDDDDEDDSEDGDDGHDAENDARVPRGVLAARLPEEAYREALVRGETTRGAMFDDETGSMVDEVEGSQMLQEEDLVRENLDQGDVDMDGDVNLDDDIPEAEEGGYEHTDTEAELTSSEEGSVDGPLVMRHQQASSMVRSDGTQNSMDMTRISLASSELGSQMGSSPAPRSGARNRRSNHNHNH